MYFLQRNLTSQTSKSHIVKFMPFYLVSMFIPEGSTGILKAGLFGREVQFPLLLKGSLATN
jgi:hypothetical protein